MLIIHERLLDYLPKVALLTIHKECCKLRKGGPNYNKRLAYLFKYHFMWFVLYHRKVLKLIKEKHSVVKGNWEDAAFTGKGCVPKVINYEHTDIEKRYDSTKLIYPEHDNITLEWHVKKIKNRGWPHSNNLLLLKKIPSFYNLAKEEGCNVDYTSFSGVIRDDTIQSKNS